MNYNQFKKYFEEYFKRYKKKHEEIVKKIKSESYVSKRKKSDQVVENIETLINKIDEIKWLIIFIILKFFKIINNY